MEFDLNTLEEFLLQFISQNNVPGMSVCVSSPDGTLYQKGFGFCDLDGTRPVLPDTIFGIGSMSKSVTCTCMAILAAEGRLSFLDPACIYLPDLRIPGTPRESLLLHHLANMTSGLPPLPVLMMSLATHTELGPWIGEEAYAASQQLEGPLYSTVGEIIEYISGSGAYEPLGAPGEIMSYSNDCYALLSSVVDAASGTTLEQFAHERIFAPLGMTRTTFDTDEAKAMGNITSLFVRQDGRLLTTDDWSCAPPYRGCGFIKSTAQDMCRYYEMLACDGVYRQRRILPEGCVDTLVGRSHPETADGVYCYGLLKRLFMDTVICDHSGGLTGISSKGGFFKDRGYAASVLMNMEDLDSATPLNAIFNTLLGLPPDTSHQSPVPSGGMPEQPRIYVGTYVSNEFFPQGRIEVLLDDAHGLRAVSAEGESELRFCDTTRFLAYGGDKPGRSIRFFVRGGRAWAMQEGSRVFQREK